MTEAIREAELTQALERAVADFQRHFGRLRTIDKLKHMTAARQEAQRLMDESSERIGGKPTRAAE